MPILIAVAAGSSPHTRDAKEIASLLNTTDRAVHRWMDGEKWV